MYELFTINNNFKEFIIITTPPLTLGAPRRVREIRRVVPRSSPVFLPHWTGRETIAFGFTGLRFWCWPPAPPRASPVVLELHGGCWTPSGGRWHRARREMCRGAHTRPTLRRWVGELKPPDFVSEARGQSWRGVGRSCGWFPWGSHNKMSEHHRAGWPALTSRIQALWCRCALYPLVSGPR